MKSNRFRKKSNIKFSSFILVLFLLAALIVSFYYVWDVFYADNSLIQFSFYREIILIVLYAMLFLGFAGIYEMFQISTSKITELINSGVLSITFTNLIMAGIILLVSQPLPNPLYLLILLLFQILFIVFWCYISHKIYFHQNPPLKSVVIVNEYKNMADYIREYGLGVRYQVIACYTLTEFLDQIEQIMAKTETVFIPNIPAHERSYILKKAIEHQVPCYMIPKISDIFFRAAKPVQLFHLPVFELQPYNPGMFFLILKRFFDVLLSALALVLISPLLLIIAVMIKAEDGGPVIYRQNRLTKNGKVFKILKFRSMTQNAEEDGVARLSSGNDDDRITKIGKFIRKFRLDELPQLINILAGDMSIVGPRPERPEIFQEYAKNLPEFSLRLQAKAGLTGYAQVYGKYNTSPFDKLLMDLLYLSKPGIIEDLKLCFATIKVLFSTKSTEGIAADQQTADDAINLKHYE